MLIKIKRSLPEYYLIASVLFYWFFTATILNPFAIGLLIVLGFQLVYQRGGAGIAIAITFLILNLFMVLALLSELAEFTEFTTGFYQLLIVGSLYLGTNILVSSIMILKYTRSKTAPLIENKAL